MKKNLLKKPNNVFIKFTCCICLDRFEAEEYVYETTNGDLVCYNCAEDDPKDIAEHIDRKIKYLEKSKKLILE